MDKKRSKLFFSPVFGLLTPVWLMAQQPLVAPETLPPGDRQLTGESERLPQIVRGHTVPRSRSQTPARPGVRPPSLCIEAAPLPMYPTPRRWTLYFPSDWRHPAIQYPPVKVYLASPYLIEDPFGWIPPVPLPISSSAPAPVIPGPAPKASPHPKVLELNPQTGRLERRRVGMQSAEELPLPR